MKRRGFNSSAPAASSRAAKLAALGKIRHDEASNKESVAASNESQLAFKVPKTMSLDNVDIPESPCPAGGPKPDDKDFKMFSDRLTASNGNAPPSIKELPDSLDNVVHGNAPPSFEAGVPEKMSLDNVIPESPCPASGPKPDDADFQMFSDMLATDYKHVFSTPRKIKEGAHTMNTGNLVSLQLFPANSKLGSLSLLNIYDSEDSQQSLSSEQQRDTHEDAFNLSKLDESLNNSLDADFQATISKKVDRLNDDHETAQESDRFDMSQLNESLDSTLHAGTDPPMLAVSSNENTVTTQTSSQGNDVPAQLDQSCGNPSDTCALDRTLPTSSLDEVSLHNLASAETSRSGDKTSLSLSDHSGGNTTFDTSRSSSSLSNESGNLSDTSILSGNLSDTSILVQTLLSTRINTSLASNEENNSNTEDGGEAVETVAFNESNRELNNEILGAIGEFTEADTLILPLEPDQAVANDEALVVEAAEVVIEVLDVPADDPSTKPRKSNPEKWKKTIAKKLYDSGAAHISLRGKLREERKMGVGCSEKCIRKCQFNFSEAHRTGIFKDFWAIQHHTMQWYYIAGLVRTTDVKKRTAFPLNPDPRRKFTNTYHFISESGTEVQVCKKFFLETLGINQKWVNTALLKQRLNHGCVPEDKRGKSKKQSPAKAAIRRGVIEHIKSFPTVESHYTRKDSKSKYLAENLNKRIMYSLYKLEKEAANETKYASLRQYRDIFQSEFNLKFFRPKKDQCARCLSWKNRTPQEKTEAGLKKFKKHISDKEKSNELKKQDSELVKSNEEARKTTCVLTCDLQKVLQCPKGMNRDFFFASKLSIYNFTIFVSGDQQGINYVWDQTEANRGAAEIASCLWNFISEKVKTGITHFIIYSDNCSSQNKNQFLFSMYAMASMRYNIKIIHRYLEVGHTHMEVDSVHARIENSVKYTDLFVPSQWYTAIRIAKKNRPHYEVIEVTQDMIFDFASIASYQSWDKVKTSTFREVVLDCDNPGQVMYKTDFPQEEHKSANILKKGPGRRVNWKTIPLQTKYSAKIPLPQLTLKHLQDLCKSGAIPSVYAPYYMEDLPKLSTAVVQPPAEELSEWEDSAESDSNDNDSERDEDYV